METYVNQNLYFWRFVCPKKSQDMSSMDCEIIGKGDCDLRKICRSDPSLSRVIVNQLISEIIDSALDIVQDLPPDADIRKIITKNESLIEEQSGKSCSKEKSKNKSREGTGDQKSDQEMISKEEAPLFEHPFVEKKNRLTDLVKNSKHLWAKLISSSATNIALQQEEHDEKVVEVIELDCIQISDLSPKFTEKEDIKVPSPSSPCPFEEEEDLLSPTNEDFMDEIKLSSPDASRDEATLKRRTFPMSSASNAKARFAAKCKTLKDGATNLKKKKWNVKGRIVNFFRRRCDKRERCDKCEKKKSLELKEENSLKDEKTDLEKAEQKI